MNNGAAEVRTLFNNKNVAMYVDGQPAVKNIQKDAPDIDVGVALWPGKSGTLNAGLGGYYIAGCPSTYMATFLLLNRVRTSAAPLFTEPSGATWCSVRRDVYKRQP